MKGRSFVPLWYLVDSAPVLGLQSHQVEEGLAGARPYIIGGSFLLFYVTVLIESCHSGILLIEASASSLWGNIRE